MSDPHRLLRLMEIREDLARISFAQARTASSDAAKTKRDLNDLSDSYAPTMGNSSGCQLAMAANQRARLGAAARKADETRVHLEGRCEDRNEAVIRAEVMAAAARRLDARERAALARLLDARAPQLSRRKPSPGN